MSPFPLGILAAAGGGGVPAPDFLTSAPLWLDAADATTITESGGSVSQWDNKGTLENFSQATSASQPTTGVNTLNGLNVLDFSADFLSGSTKTQWTFLHDGTLYFFAAVWKIGNSATPGTLVLLGNNEGSTSNIGFHHRRDPSDDFTIVVTKGVSGSPAVNFSDENFLPANTPVISSAVIDPDLSAANRVQAFVNDTQSTATNPDSNSPSTSSPTYNLEIGTYGNGNNPLTGQIAELIIVSGADATESNRQTTVDYLNSKWGVF